MKWILPKAGDPRMETYGKRINEAREPLQKWKKEGIIKSSSSWADNTGLIVGLWEFENAEAFSKLWGQEEFHRLMTRICGSVNNAEIRVMRPAGFEPGTMKIIQSIV
jgi:hypothetical protein